MSNTMDEKLKSILDIYQMTGDMSEVFRHFWNLEKDLLSDHPSFILTLFGKSFLKEMLDDLLNDDERLTQHYETELSKNMKGIIDRTKKLGSTYIKLRPSQEIMIYINEASRCYIYGLFNGCIVLCRALVQDGLTTELRKRGLNVFDLEGKKKGKGEIEQAIDKSFASGILGKKYVKKAHDIRKMGNKCVHGRILGEKEAFKALTDTKDILEHIFG